MGDKIDIEGLVPFHEISSDRKMSMNSNNTSMRKKVNSKNVKDVRTSIFSLIDKKPQIEKDLTVKEKDTVNEEQKFTAQVKN